MKRDCAQWHSTLENYDKELLAIVDYRCNQPGHCYHRQSRFQDILPIGLCDAY